MIQRQRLGPRDPTHGAGMQLEILDGHGPLAALQGLGHAPLGLIDGLLVATARRREPVGDRAGVDAAQAAPQ